MKRSQKNHVATVAAVAAAESIGGVKTVGISGIKTAG